MITAAINIFIYTTFFLIIGLFKPNWALFFIKKANRFMVIIISAVLFMVAATLFGEGNREKQLEQQEIISSVTTAPVPVPVPK